MSPRNSSAYLGHLRPFSFCLQQIRTRCFWLAMWVFCDCLEMFAKAARGKWGRVFFDEPTWHAPDTSRRKKRAPIFPSASQGRAPWRASLWENQCSSVVSAQRLAGMGHPSRMSGEQMPRRSYILLACSLRSLPPSRSSASSFSRHEFRWERRREFSAVTSANRARSPARSCCASRRSDRACLRSARCRRS